jgi:hypothetical protein
MNAILKAGIILAAILTSLFAHAESKSDKIYNLFSGKEGVTYFSFSKSVVKPFEIFLDDESKKVIYKMDKVRFISYDHKDGKLSTQDVSDKIIRVFTENEYFEMNPEEFKIKSDEGNVDGHIRMFGLGDKSNMDEVHIFIKENNDCLLFSFYGKITIEDLKYCKRLSKSIKVNITTD